MFLQRVQRDDIFWLAGYSVLRQRWRSVPTISQSRSEIRHQSCFVLRIHLHNAMQRAGHHEIGECAVAFVTLAV